MLVVPLANRLDRSHTSSDVRKNLGRRNESEKGALFDNVGFFSQIGFGWRPRLGLEWKSATTWLFKRGAGATMDGHRSAKSICERLWTLPGIPKGSKQRLALPCVSPARAYQSRWFPAR